MIRLASLMTGRFFAGSGQFVEADIFDRFADVFDGVGLVLGVPLFLRILDDVFHRTAFGGVNGVELVGDGLFGGDERSDFQLGDALDVVDGQAR